MYLNLTHSLKESENIFGYLHQKHILFKNFSEKHNKNENNFSFNKFINCFRCK